MARTAVPTFTTGQIVTAAFMNTYMKDNEAEHWAQIQSIESDLSLIKPVNIASVYGCSSSIPNNSETAISWKYNGIVDPSGMHSETVEPEKINILTTGYYVVSLNVMFDLNGAGSRACRIFIGNTLLSAVSFPANSTLTNGGSVTQILKLVSGQYLVAKAWQNSGGALNL